MVKFKHPIYGEVSLDSTSYILVVDSSGLVQNIPASELTLIEESNGKGGLSESGKIVTTLLGNNQEYIENLKSQIKGE